MITFRNTLPFYTAPRLIIALILNNLLTLTILHSISSIGIDKK